ncbi:hypothetical protein HDV05_003538 [Chytridiales sp. JEL 0842]|nr:hypothetical protein HDV05_003538 [Chytridiales sp. JEL 0842]
MQSAESVVSVSDARRPSADIEKKPSFLRRLFTRLKRNRVLPYLVVLGVIVLIGIIVAVVLVVTRRGSSVPPKFATLVPSGQTVNATLTPFDGDLLNKDIGFSKYYRSDSTSPTPLTQAVIDETLREDNMTLIYTLYNLAAFRSSPISASYLSMIASDLDLLRANGLSSVLRFTYTATLTSAAPYGDVPIDIMINHIDQIKAILVSHADVISVLQHGFIGTWGGGYYTDYFGGPANYTADGLLAPEYLQLRKRVLDALLAAMPKSRAVQTRYVRFMTSLPGQSVQPLTSTEAFTGTDLSRVFLHNDCLLDPNVRTDSERNGTQFPDDLGTFRSISEREYYIQQSSFGYTGGQTCSQPTTVNTCAQAQAELERFKYSFVDSGFNPATISNWRANGCFNEFKRRLGYRFTAQGASYTPFADRFNVSVWGTNEGFAHVFNEQRVQVIVEGAFKGSPCVATIDPMDVTHRNAPFDVRRWEAGKEWRMDLTVGLPIQIDGSTPLDVGIVVEDKLAGARKEQGGVRESWGRLLFGSRETLDFQRRVNWLFRSLSVNMTAVADNADHVANCAL